MKTNIYSLQNSAKLLLYSDVFSGEIPSVEELLRNIDRKILLEYAVRFCNYPTHNEVQFHYNSFLRDFFKDIESDEYKYISYRISMTEKSTGLTCHIAFPISSLTLFSICHKMNEDIADVETDFMSIRLKIFKSYIILNQKYVEKGRLESQKLDHLPYDRKVFLQGLAGSVYTSDLVNSTILINFNAQFHKFQQLFIFLAKNENTQLLLEKCLDRFKFKTLDQLFGLMAIFLDSVQATPNNIVDLRGSLAVDKIDEIIEVYVLNTQDTDYQDDFYELRNKPIMRLEKGCYRIIYNKFFLDKFYKGWYFFLNELNKSFDKKDRIKGDFRGFYTTEFTERFLVYDLMENIFPKKSIQISGDYIKELWNKNNISMDGEPDYYVRDFNNIYLFEIKDALIPKEIKSSYDFYRIESAIKEKILRDKNGDSKGITQLLNSIVNIKSNNTNYDSNSRLDKCNIFPILILSDEIFNATGLNQLANEWYLEEINKYKEKHKDIIFNKLHPVIIITIDTLILIKQYISTGKIRFKELIEKYIEYHLTNDIKKKIKKSNSTVSFSQFSYNYMQDKLKKQVIPDAHLFIIDKLKDVKKNIN